MCSIDWIGVCIYGFQSAIRFFHLRSESPPNRKTDSLRKKSSCLKQFVAPALQVNQAGAGAGVASLYITEAYFQVVTYSPTPLTQTPSSSSKKIHRQASFHWWEVRKVSISIYSYLKEISYHIEFLSQTIVDNSLVFQIHWLHKVGLSDCAFAIFISNALETICNFVGCSTFHSLISWKICHRLIKLCLQSVVTRWLLAYGCLRVWAAKWQWTEMASNLHATAADLFRFHLFPPPSRHLFLSLSCSCHEVKGAVSWPTKADG